LNNSFLSTDPPKILTSPLSETKIENQTATFICIFKGKPEPNLDWFRNESKFDTNDARVTVHESKDFRNATYTLTIKNLTRKDEGMYKCVVNNNITSNGLSDVPSEVAILTVNCKYTVP